MPRRKSRVRSSGCLGMRMKTGINVNGDWASCQGDDMFES